MLVHDESLRMVETFTLCQQTSLHEGTDAGAELGTVSVVMPDATPAHRYMAITTVTRRLRPIHGDEDHYMAITTVTWRLRPLHGDYDRYMAMKTVDSGSSEASVNG